MFSRFKVTVIVLLCIAIAVSGAAFAMSLKTTAEGEAVKKVIVMGTTDSITVLDPAKTYDFYTWEVFYNLSEGLLKHKPGTAKVVPGIAKSYKISDDRLKYTFKLRKGLKFTDGAPLDAHAIKYSVDRVMKLGLDPSWLVTEFVKKVEVVDKYTVRFVLENPISFFPALIATTPYLPMSPKSFPKSEIAEPKVGHYGPYKIKKWVKDVELVLEANPNYYGEPPKTKHFVVKFFKSAATMRMALETGEIDIAWKTLRPMDIVDLREIKKIKVLEEPGPYIRYIVCRCNKPPFNDVRLRRAVAYALDRKRICKEVYKGTVEPLYSMVPIGMWSHISAFKKRYGKRNLDKAKDLLKEAGYSEEKPFEFELWYTPKHYGPLERDVATVIKESLERTKMMKVKLKSAEWGTYAAEYIINGVMPIFLLGWYPDYVDPDDYTTPFFHSKYSPHMGVSYSNPEMDKVLEDAMVKVEMSERAEFYKKAQKIMAEDTPIIPFFQGKLNACTRVGIKGVVLDPHMLLRYFLIYKVS